MHVEQRNDLAISDVLNIFKTQALGMWRFRWLSVAVAWAICVVGWASVYTMPDVYQANARVFVDTENAIEDFLGGLAAPTDVLSEVTIVVREIVSRPNLAEVARNTDLALRARTDAQFENLLTSLQDRITVEGNREGIYSIAFEDTSRDTALSVVDTLLTAFVEKSLGADRTDSAQAQKFLQDQIAEYESRLTAAEDKLAAFKRENVALMPDQQGDYFSRLQAAEAALQLTVGKLNLETERRAELMRQIEGEEPVFGIMPSGPNTGTMSSSTQKILELEMQLEELRLKYTDKHPRIGQLLNTIELLREQESQDMQRIAESGGELSQQNPLDLNPVYQNMRIQLSNVNVAIAALRAERDQQQEQVAELKRLVDTVPQVEAELNRLNRDYNVVRAKHQQLLQQLETANIGEDVSRSIDEIQFRIIDPPFSDTKPAGPVRPLLMSAVLMLAVGVGIAIAFLLNLLKPTFIGNRSVTEVLGIPVLSSVSLLQTDTQRRKERMDHYALQVAAGFLLVAFVVLTRFAESGSQWIRQISANMT